MAELYSGEIFYLRIYRAKTLIQGSPEKCFFFVAVVMNVVFRKMGFLGGSPDECGWHPSQPNPCQHKSLVSFF